MSPTAATLNVALGRGVGTCVGFKGLVGLSVTGVGGFESLVAGGASGVLLQAPSTRNSGNNHHLPFLVPVLVAKTNSDNVNVRLVQAAAKHVQLVQVGDRPDANTMIGAIVDGYALDH
jgi:hypothetical protein